VRGRRILELALIVLLALTPRAALGEPTPPGPATLDDLGSATQESVTRLLAKTRRKYGEDAVVIQTQLLLHALRVGSHLATGVRVAGVDQYQGARYLRFELETGLIFDDLTRDADQRVHMLWATILEPTLATIEDLEVEPAGIAVVMQSHHRPYRTAQELRETIDEPGVPEAVTFYVLEADVSAVRKDGGGSLRPLFGRCRITVDDAERTVPAPAGAPPTLPGPV